MKLLGVLNKKCSEDKKWDIDVRNRLVILSHKTKSSKALCDRGKWKEAKSMSKSSFVFTSVSLYIPIKGQKARHYSVTASAINCHYSYLGLEDTHSL